LPDCTAGCRGSGILIVIVIAQEDFMSQVSSMMSESPDVDAKKARTTQQLFEKQWIKKEMAGFLPSESAACEYIDTNFPGLNKITLLSLCQVVSEYTQVPITREFTRRKITLQKWLHNHWELFGPFIRDHISAIYEPIESTGTSHD
jgi:hypothetical protein